MGASERLQVRVNDELALDAGTCEEVTGAHGPRRYTTESSLPCGHASSRSSENSNMSRAVNGALGS
jgi:hypothetical protein